MPLDGLYAWSQTAGNNAAADSAVNWTEYQNADTVNDSARAVMARVAAYIRDLAPTRASSGGTSNAFDVTAASQPGIYVDAFTVAFRAHQDVTGPCTININGMGSKPFRPAVAREFRAGDIKAGAPIACFYNGATDEVLALGSGFYVNELFSGLHTAAPYRNLLAAGFIGIWPTEAIPTGWIEAAGQAVSRTAYAQLFQAYGTRYGVGDGSTTFNVPDYRGEFLRGWDHGKASDPDRSTRTNRGDGTTGDVVGTKQAGAIEGHTHGPGSLGTAVDPGHAHAGVVTVANAGTVQSGTNNAAIISAAGGSTATAGSHSHAVTAGATSSTGGAETRGRNVGVVYCILADPLAATVASYGLAAVQYDREIAGLEIRPLIADAFTGVTKNANRSWTAGANADCYFDLPVTAAMLATGNVWVDIKILSGALSAIAYEQRSSSGSVVAPLAMLAESSRRVVRGITLNSATTLIRVRFQTAAGGGCTFMAPSIGQGEPATFTVDTDLAVMDNIQIDAANAATNLWTDPTLAAVIAPVATRTGKTYTLAALAWTDFTQPVSGLVATDTVSILVQLATPIAKIFLAPSGTGGEGPQTKLSDLGGGWYGARGISVQQANAAAATNFRIGFDNRSGGGWTAQSVNIQQVWIGKNTASYPDMLNVPGPVTAAFVKNRVGVAYVDPTNGQDADAGTEEKPYATLSQALASGAATIFVRVNAPVRFTSQFNIINVNKLTIAAWRKTVAGIGDTANQRARLLGSVNYPAASWTAAGGATPNLFYISLAANPDSCWELDAAGTPTRLFFNAKGPTTLPSAAPDLASANSQPGAFFYDSAAQRLYVYPWGGTITGKSYEVPVATKGLVLTSCGAVELIDIEIAYTRDAVLPANGSSVVTRNCLFGRNGNLQGTGTACGPGNGGTWTDHGSSFIDAGNDGFGFGDNATGTLIGSTFNNNRGDGCSQDGANTNCVLVGCDGSFNGKDGTGRIGTGETRIEGGRYVGNGSVDVIMTFVGAPAANKAVFDMNGVIADQTLIDQGTLGSVTSNIRNHTGPIQTASGNVTINGLRAHGDGTGTGKSYFGLRCDGGNVTVIDARISRYNYGIMLTGGTLKLRGGNIMRSTGTSGANIFQSGGVFDLDAADPINQFGGTGFSGVSPGDQGKTVNFSVA